MKGELCGQQGRLVRGQLASRVRGRWNSAGTSGREQREYWGGGGAKGHRGRGKARGRGQDPAVLAHSSDGSPTLGDLMWGGGQFSLIWGEEGQLSKCSGVGGGVLPSGQPQLIT